MVSRPDNRPPQPSYGPPEPQEERSYGAPEPRSHAQPRQQQRTYSPPQPQRSFSGYGEEKEPVSILNPFVAVRLFLEEK